MVSTWVKMWSAGRQIILSHNGSPILEES